MLRLEGQVNGRRVNRAVADQFEALAHTSVLLDGLPALRLERVLRSLECAAAGGRSWGWSAEEFNLSLRPD